MLYKATKKNYREEIWHFYFSHVIVATTDVWEGGWSMEAIHDQLGVTWPNRRELALMIVNQGGWDATYSDEQLVTAMKQKSGKRVSELEVECALTALFSCGIDSFKDNPPLKCTFKNSRREEWVSILCFRKPRTHVHRNQYMTVSEVNHWWCVVSHPA